MKQTILAMVSLFLLLLVSTVPAYGLSCAQPSRASEEFDTSESVFRGTVTGKKRTASGTAVTFKVHEVWKGSPARAVELLESDMWLTFEKGKQYLVYVDTDKDGRRANLCGNTKPWELGRTDAATFGASSIALYDEERPGFPGWGIPAVVGATAISAYFAFRFWRGRASRH
jgi:hypothetical protein